MSNKHNKRKFQPKAGGKKKKTKKKKKQSNDIPDLDPHFAESISQQQELKPKQKRQRKTKFEMDISAPTIQISGGYNRMRNTNNAPRTANIPRRPRNTRTATSKVVFGATNTNKMGADDLERAEKKIRKQVFLPTVLEDKSDNECDEKEEKKDVMDIDNDKEEEYDYDPWINNENNNGNNNNSNEMYTPTTLKRKPNYGKNGIFVDSEMLNVFKEKEQSGNEFIFMQMPPVLPLISHLNEDEQRDMKNNRKVKDSLLRQMGEGEIGKIRIRKSGKCELVIGEYVMDIGFSSPIDCYQQVMYIQCENTSDRTVKGKSQFLGDVPPQNNLVCSYRADDLLK